MKLKLDLHSLFDDGRRIEAALQDIIDQAVHRPREIANAVSAMQMGCSSNAL